MSYTEENRSNDVHFCNARLGGRTHDFSTVPPYRVFEYDNKCYDMEEIITYFNKNWFKLNFNFTIDNTKSISFRTAFQLSNTLFQYNCFIHTRSQRN